jgi:hypothetical protein
MPANDATHSQLPQLRRRSQRHHSIYSRQADPVPDQLRLCGRSA